MSSMSSGWNCRPPQSASEAGRERPSSDVSDDVPEFVGQDPKVLDLFELVSLVADTDATVLITGETGTGKELIARRILTSSRRRDRPYVTVNCPAVAETLQESELFGYVRGAFTGADHGMIGRFEAADGGTVFLDEVSEMSQRMQVKLLRVLQSGEYTPLGTAKSRTCDVRVIAATNQDLEALVAQGRFRKDLYYRLNIICLQIPALRHRRGDIFLLINHFLARFSKIYHKDHLEVDPDVLRLLMSYEFPGNVRQLEHIMMRAVILCKGRRIELAHLPPQLDRSESAFPSESPALFHQAKAQTIETFERGFLSAALSECGGLVTRAARRVGLSERNFHAKLKKYKMSSSAFRAR